MPCEEVDRATGRIIAEAGYGEYFIHRTGHGIGMEEHEDPYMVEGNARPLAPGHAYSVEPGIYLPGRWGMRLEDIVVATEDGPQPLNHADHHAGGARRLTGPGPDPARHHDDRQPRAARARRGGAPSGAGTSCA